MTKSSTQTLTADEIKRTVHALIESGRYANVQEVADEIGVVRSALYLYMKVGLPPQRLNRHVLRRLVQLTNETGARCAGE